MSKVTTLHDRDTKSVDDLPEALKKELSKSYLGLNKRKADCVMKIEDLFKRLASQGELPPEGLNTDAMIIGHWKHTEEVLKRSSVAQAIRTLVKQGTLVKLQNAYYYPK